MFIDYMTGLVERSEKTSEHAEYAAWLKSIDMPPNTDLFDRETCEHAIVSAYLAEYKRASDAALVMLRGDSTVPDAEDAPPGWSNAELLAQMQSSMRHGW